MPAHDLSRDFLREVQIALRAAQPDVPEVCGEGGKPCAEIHALLVPEQEAHNGERVPLMPKSA